MMKNLCVGEFMMLTSVPFDLRVLHTLHSDLALLCAVGETKDALVSSAGIAGWDGRYVPFRDYDLEA
jgi:hypothetical protein